MSIPIRGKFHLMYTFFDKANIPSDIITDLLEIEKYIRRAEPPFIYKNDVYRFNREHVYIHVSIEKTPSSIMLALDK